MKKRLLPILLLTLLTSMSFAATYTLKVTVPAETKVCYVSGGFNTWSQPGTEMNKVSDSPKVFTVDVDVADTTGVKYKYCAGPAWDYQQTRSADFWMGDLTAEGDTVDAFQAYYDPAAQPVTVTIDVLVPVEVYELYITGNFNSWNPTANKMEKVDSTADGKEFALTIEVTDSNTLEYKFVAGPGWSYEQTSSTNYKYSVDGGTVVCDAFKAIYDPTKVGDITVNITVPEGTPDVYLIGDFSTPNWSLAGAIHATKNLDGTYTAVIPMVQTVQYKCWNYPDWPYEEAIDAAGTGLPSNRTATFETDPVVNITVAFWKQIHSSSGIKAIDASKYIVYSINRNILVEGVNETVKIYDLNGRMVESARLSGSFTSKQLNPGLYIILIDGYSKKVIVN